MEAIDNVQDFLSFVDRSSKCEISSRGYRHAGAINRRNADPHPGYLRTNRARLPWRRGLTLLFGFSRNAEAD
jgi:hypothetical protein